MGGDHNLLVADLMTRYGTGAAEKGFGSRWDEPMMFGGSKAVVLVHGVLAIITWILVAGVLLALLRWLWAKGDKERRR